MFESFTPTFEKFQVVDLNSAPSFYREREGGKEGRREGGREGGERWGAREGERGISPGEEKAGEKEEEQEEGEGGREGGREGEGGHVSSSICLRVCCYAMSGTDSEIAHGAMRVGEQRGLRGRGASLYGAHTT
eukprot:1181715-Rhodomonas_salina.1